MAMAHAPPLARPAQPRAATSATVMRHHPGPVLRPLAARRQAVAHATSSAEVHGFADSSLSEFKVAIMGDLHLAPEQMHLFHAARSQLVANMSGPDGKPHPGARVVQLGDLGHSKHKSGSTSCFEFAKSFISGFGVPSALVLGNHDLEGEEFETDAENLAAWRATMGQPHYWSARLGPALLVGLSTVRYRSNYISHHEVYIDDEQQAWLEALLEANRGTPTVIFTHAPPMGCGLKVIQEVHVKNRCAWLNHSDDPARFMRLLARHRETVRLWFSGHFHLSHNYPDSITTVGPTAFVQTGVIGTCNRDGFRHSRLLTGDAEGFKLYTVDHEATGAAAPRLDLQQRWDDLSPPKPMLPPEDELLCDPSSGGWLCSKLECHVGEDNAFVRWVGIGQRTILALQDDLLVEYDMGTAAPIGLVGLVPHGSELKLLTVDGCTSSSEDGSDIAEIKIVDAATGEVRSSHPRNQWGGFFQIYQPNKWRLKKAKEAAAKAAAAVPTS